MSIVSPPPSGGDLLSISGLGYTPANNYLITNLVCIYLTASLSHLTNHQSPTNTLSLHLNQDTALRCLVSQNQLSWAQRLLWVQHANNSLNSSATGAPLFQCVKGYQPLTHWYPFHPVFQRS